MSENDFSDPFMLLPADESSSSTIKQQQARRRIKQPTTALLHHHNNNNLMMHYRDESSVLQDQVNRLRSSSTKNKWIHDDRLQSSSPPLLGKTSTEDDNKKQNKNKREQEAPPLELKSSTGSVPTLPISKLKSTERTRQRYGFPTALLAYDGASGAHKKQNKKNNKQAAAYGDETLDDEGRRGIITGNNAMITMNPLNFDQRDLVAIHGQLQNFLMFCCCHDEYLNSVDDDDQDESTNRTSGSNRRVTADAASRKKSNKMHYFEKQILEKELAIEMHNGGVSYIDHWRKLLVNKEQSDAASGDDEDHVNRLIDKEMKRLIQRGKKRMRDMSAAIQFLMTQHIVSARDVRRAYETAYDNRQRPPQSNQRMSKVSSSRSQRSMIPVNYDLRRQHLYNEQVMSVFQGKHSHLFDPFHGMGIEPPLNSSSYDPTLFQNAVFNPPLNSSRRDALPTSAADLNRPSPTTNYYGHGMLRNQNETRREWIPMIPQRRQRSMRNW